jgi:hypothetical protein
MSFAVDWLPDAERELTEIWLKASDRDAVTNAANWIDERLRLDPEHEGESRPENRRVLFARPLAVVFRVSPPDRSVVVSHVWQFGKLR